MKILTFNQSMNRLINQSMSKYIQLFKMILVILFMGCADDDSKPVPFVNFTNTELGVEGSAEVDIVFSRASESDGVLTISITSSSLQYGETLDYYTEPEATNGEIILDYDAGDNTASFTILASATLNIQQDEMVIATLSDANNSNVIIGDNANATLIFSENFIASGGTLELDGGGREFPNQAFIDLSKLRQTTANKYSWDLGFYTASGSHHVILNNSAYVMARPLDKTDLNAVSSSDTTGFASLMYISNYRDPQAANWIDHQNGDLTDTAFGTISENDSENKVFIIKRDGEGRNWKKVRVLKDDDNYILLHANIDAPSYEMVTIIKNDAYHFNFFDLDNGEVNVEPEKDSWDFMYSSYANRYNNNGVTLAVGFNDFITINREGSAAMINTSQHAYEDFDVENLDEITFEEDNISIIGDSWRSLVNFNLVLNEDRFYVVKDGNELVYKVQFTRLTSKDGERGYPEIKMERIK